MLHPWGISDSAQHQASRALMKRYELRTPMSKLAHLRAIGEHPQSKNVEDVEPTLMKVEANMTRSELLAQAFGGIPLSGGTDQVVCPRAR